MDNTKIKHAYLSFKLNSEIFAVSAFKVLEVFEKQHITAVPNVPDYIMGVINFRGEVLPVVDTRKKFNMPDRTDDQKFVIIVLELSIDGEQLRLGAIADSVKDVIEIDETEIKEVPKMGSSYNSEYIKGMIHTDKGFTLLLDVDKIFSSDKVELMVQNEES